MQRPRLNEIDPAGRLDVLLYRLAEYAAEQFCRPEEWRIFNPFVEQFIAGLFGRRA